MANTHTRIQFLYLNTLTIRRRECFLFSLLLLLLLLAIVLYYYADDDANADDCDDEDVVGLMKAASQTTIHPVSHLVYHSIFC